MSRHRCTSPTPIDIASGQVLGPGEFAYLDPEHPHNSALISDGRLMAAPEPKSKAKPPSTASETEEVR